MIRTVAGNVRKLVLGGFCPLIAITLIAVAFLFVQRLPEPALISPTQHGAPSLKPNHAERAATPDRKNLKLPIPR